jgi:small-conductance mechanosensitive channel
MTAAFVAAAAVGWMYISAERKQRRELATENQALAASLAQVQTQLQTVGQRMSELVARQAEPPAPARIQAKARVRPAGSVQIAQTDSGLGQIRSQLAEQQHQIASAREDIDKTRNQLSQARDELEGTIDSAKTELNGSIARTHDEVVALQKRGQRNYYEFAIDKSKRYSRVGPLSLELRKADVKHKRFDVMMLVEDNELQKKGVNLYENVWISLSDRPQPLELVVNKISKDHVEGYLSEPKYKKSELESSVAANN